jgi:hypothetical protein
MDTQLVTKVNIRKRKEITTNYSYKLKKTDRKHTHHKVKNNKEILY